MLLAPPSLSVFLAVSLFLSLDLAVLVRSGLVKGEEGSCKAIPGTWHEGSCVPVTSVLVGPRGNPGDQTCLRSTWTTPRGPQELLSSHLQGGESSLVGLGRPTSRFCHVSPEPGGKDAMAPGHSWTLSQL